MKKEAKFYIKKENNHVQCQLCPHFCIIAENKTGFCKIRKNINGILYNIGYGETVSLSMDPIEKKPLYHFKPGTQILSIAPNGCNLRCPFCQNFQISQNNVETTFISVDKISSFAKDSESIGIAYTYSEPIIWYEYVLDTSKKIKQYNKDNILISNGMINPEPLEKLIKYIDAANIDLKSFSEKKYKEILKGNLRTVLNTIETLYRNNIHIEITTLIVTDFNDSNEEIESIIKFISSLDKNIPFHLSKYYPHYKYNSPPTDENKLLNFYNFAKKHLNFVFIGNTSLKNTNNSYCPDCGNLWIKREFYNISIKGIINNKCSECHKEIKFPI